MKFYKVIENEKITMLGKSKRIPENSVEITEEEYNVLLSEIKAHAQLVNEYVAKVQAEEIKLEEVPEDCYAEVEAIINAPQPEPEDITQSVEWQAGYDQAVIDLLGSEV